MTLHKKLKTTRNKIKLKTHVNLGKNNNLKTPPYKNKERLLFCDNYKSVKTRKKDILFLTTINLNNYKAKKKRNKQNIKKAQKKS